MPAQQKNDDKIKREKPTDKRDENAKQLWYHVWVIAYTTRAKEKQNLKKKQRT